MVYKFFDSKVSGSSAKLVLENEQLADEHHKPIIRKFEKRKVYSTFKDNIWGVDLVDMQLLSKYNKGIRFLLCVIDIFSKYAWVVPLKDEKGISIVKAFQIILKQSNRKPNKIWIDKGSEFYNGYFKKWLRDKGIVMYSTHNEGKSVVAEKFIRTLKSKIYKYMTSISKNVYIDKLNDIVDEYNDTYHTTIKMKPIEVKDNTHINTSKEINNKDPKFKVADHVRISKYKNIFAKGYMPNWSEEVFVIKKVKNTIPWTYVFNDLNGEEIIGTFYEKELQKTNREEFRIEKVIRQKGDKLHVKWKGYDNSFNSWIDKASSKNLSSKNLKKRYYTMSYYPPYRSSRNNIKVELNLANYATKVDVKNITHVDVSSFTSKTNLAALKTEVDKIDADKLKTTPTDLAKLTNATEHDVVKKTDYNTKVISIEAQITGLTKNTTDNSNDITKLKAFDTNNFVLKTKFSADINTLDDKIDGVEKNPQI